MHEAACRSQLSAFSRYCPARDWIETSLYPPNGWGARLFRASKGADMPLRGRTADVRFGSKADICTAIDYVRFTESRHRCVLPAKGQLRSSTGKTMSVPLSKDPDQLCSLASFEITKLGFDEPGKGKN